MFWKMGPLLLAIMAPLVSCDDCGDQITAQLYDRDRACLGAWQAVGCNPNKGSCPAATTYAVDETGRCFFFRDLCVPTGFVRVTDADARCPSPGTPTMNCP